jgi:WD40 repeat protein
MDENLKKIAELEKMGQWNGADRIDEYCKNVKKEIKTATMRVFDEVFKQHSLLLGRVEEFNRNCLEYLDLNPVDFNVNYLVKEVKHFDAAWRNNLNKHRIDKKEISVATEEASKLQHRIEQKIHEINSVIFNNKTCEFTSSENAVPKNIIGQISTKSKSPVSYGVYATLFGHADCVDCLKVLNNGDLVSASWDKTIKIWDLHTGEVKKTLLGHNDSINDLLILDNDELASASDDCTIRIWNTHTGGLKSELIGHTGYVLSLTLLNNGDLASCSGDGTIKIWNTKTGSTIHTLSGHTSIVYVLLALENGDLISGSKDQTIKIWRGK